MRFYSFLEAWKCNPLVGLDDKCDDMKAISEYIFFFLMCILHLEHICFYEKLFKLFLISIKRLLNIQDELFLSVRFSLIYQSIGKTHTPSSSRWWSYFFSPCHQRKTTSLIVLLFNRHSTRWHFCTLLKTTERNAYDFTVNCRCTFMKDY